MVFLKCMHSLCRLCKAKLQQNACPFCRTAFEDAAPKGDGIVNTLPRDSLRANRAISIEEYTSIYEGVLRVRVRRRRRRRRTATNIIDTDHGSVVVETPYADAVFNKKQRKRKKPKAGKEKRRKAKWGRMNAHVRAGQMTSR
jgi:hypothetical protein